MGKVNMDVDVDVDVRGTCKGPRELRVERCDLWFVICGLCFVSSE